MCKLVIKAPLYTEMSVTYNFAIMVLFHKSELFASICCIWREYGQQISLKHVFDEKKMLEGAHCTVYP